MSTSMDGLIYKFLRNTQGFSLVQVSLMVAVAGIVMASVLPGGTAGSDAEKIALTKYRMEKVEEAMHAYMAQLYRRPCPASGILALTHASFGVAATTGGDCITTGALLANFGDTVSVTCTRTINTSTLTACGSLAGLSVNMVIQGTGITARTRVLAFDDTAHTITMDLPATATGTTLLRFAKIVAGGVPTNTLGLPDEFAFDGWGRRMIYMVDNRATNIKSCRDMQVHGTPGDLAIVPTSSSTMATDSVMWALMSYGKDGHGAFPMQGSSIVNRINVGATDTDTLNNAFVNSSFTYAASTAGTFSTRLVRKDKTSTFDDIVWTSEPWKNTCCVGQYCNYGFRIDGYGMGDVWNQVTTGDINGDGVQDIIIPTPQDVDLAPTQLGIYVIFGKRTLLPGGHPTTSQSTQAYPTLSGLDGFFIEIPNDYNLSAYPFGMAVKTGDVNGDGYDDIIIPTAIDTTNDATENPTQNYWVYFGGTGVRACGGAFTPWTVTVKSYTIGLAPNGCAAALLKYDHLATPGALAIGDFNGDGIQDIYTGNDSNIGYITFGDTGDWVGTTDLPTTHNVFLTTSEPGSIDISIDGADTGEPSFAAAGDFNGDGYDDLAIRGISDNGYAYVVLGRATGSWNATEDLVTNIADGNAFRFYSSDADVDEYATNVYAGDLNLDGRDDLIVQTIPDQINVYFGGSWTGPDIDTKLSAMTTGGFVIDYTENNTFGSNVTSLAVADINGDNRPDILLGDKYANVGGSTANGVVFAIFSPAVANSIQKIGPLISDPNKLSGFYIPGIADDEFTGTVATGDVNGDGISDVMIGAPGRVSTDVPTMGVVYVLMGRHAKAPWRPIVDLTPLVD